MNVFKHTLSRLTLSAVLGLAALSTAPVIAAPSGCTPIISLPHTIVTSGSYCLVENLLTDMTGGNAIEIKVDDVSIDLGGYVLEGNANQDTESLTGVFGYKLKNVVIKNGVIRGFRRAIHLLHGSPYTMSGHVVSNITALNTIHVGISVGGQGNTLSHNRVMNTGPETKGYALGIVTYGPSNKIVHNTVLNTKAADYGIGYGMRLFDAHNSLLTDNTISETLAQSGVSYAIHIDNSKHVILRDNNITDAVAGLLFSNSSGKYANTLTDNVGTPYFGGTPVGLND